jgi:peptidyl-prolyl cis-trans isomerase SurA
VTFGEVQRFYDEHRDSLPVIPATVAFSNITRIARAGDSSLAAARERIHEARRRLDGGEDFADVARALSQDPGSAAAGGDVGSFGRGVMVPEFETAAFALDSGQISSPVLTQYGLHLIQNLGSEGSEVHVRHILAAAGPGPADYAAAQDTMSSVYRRLREGADFTETARSYSMDPNVRQTGGRVEPISPDDLPPAFASVLSTLDIGQVSEPFVADPGTYHIIKLASRTREHRMNLTDDRRQIEELVRQEKLFARMQEVLDRERERIYVDLRMPDCAPSTDARLR